MYSVTCSCCGKQLTGKKRCAAKARSKACGNYQCVMPDGHQGQHTHPCRNHKGKVVAWDGEADAMKSCAGGEP